MKNKGFAPIIILVLIVLVVIGYFGYKNYWPKAQNLIVSSPPSPVPSIPTDWKTYTNSQYGYSIKIPQSWEYNNTGLWVTSFEDKGGSAGDFASFTIESREKIPLEDYLKQTRPTNINTKIDNDSQIANLKAIKLITKTGTMFQHQWFLTNKNFMYIISYNSLQESNSFGQILSTLKFAN